MMIKLTTLKIGFKTRSFSPNFYSIDSLRFNALLMKILALRYDQEVVSKISKNTFFSFSSPMIIENNNLYLPLRVLEFFVTLANTKKVDRKKVKGLVFIPTDKLEEIIPYINEYHKEGSLQNSTKLDKIIEEIGKIKERFEIKESYIIKNEIDRFTHESKNVYAIPLQVIPTNEILVNLIYTSDIEGPIKEGIKLMENFGISSKYSIGFGMINNIITNENTIKYVHFIEGKTKFQPENGILRKGYHLLLSKMLVTKDFINKINLKRSVYILKKIKGAVDGKRNYGYYMVEGSIIYIKESFEPKPEIIRGKIFGKKYLNISFPVTYYLGDSNEKQ